MRLRQLGVSYEIIVVDDGSRDETAAEVLLVSRYRQCGAPAAASGQPRLRGGPAPALRRARRTRGLHRCGQPVRSCRSRPVAAVRKPIRSPSATEWLGRDPWLRKFYSRGYNLLAGRTLLGTTVRDIDCALKVFRRDALVRLLPATGGFFVNTEMLTRARQLGLAVVETGVRHRPRLRGESKCRFATFPGRSTRVAILVVAGDVRRRPRSDAPRLVRPGGLACGCAMACVLFLGRRAAPAPGAGGGAYAEIPRQMFCRGAS